MNIFSALRVYAGKWQVKDTRNFTSDEILADVIKRAEFWHKNCNIIFNDRQKKVARI